MKLKIVSDGTHAGTTLVDAATGEPVPGVVGVTWSAGMTAPTDSEGAGRQPFATIVMRGVEVEVIADADTTQ